MIEIDPATFARRLIGWYRRHRRDLPWRVARGAPRGSRPDAYHVLVSELMLQQTQVATVIPYFLRFIEAFPTVRHLADADEQRVLRLWQGLGYYSRARNLRLAARVLTARFGGAVPADVDQLRTLPGVGRYTAGAIASLAFDRCEPIVDGNVARVLCRLDRVEADPRDKATQTRLWARATELVPKRRAGDFNSAMMELGATICTPKSPACLMCPVRAHCRALAGGVQERIPRPRAVKPLPLVERRAWCIRRNDGRGVQWLIEQRPPRGRWAGMWQFVTRPADESPPYPIGRRRKLGTVAHALTHRRYQIDVYLCDSGNDRAAADCQTRWVRLDDLDRYPLPRPQVKIAQMLESWTCPTGAAVG